METVGFFGKIPAARDFVFHGVSHHFIEAWSGAASGWLAQARDLGGTDWKRGVLTSPVWRFMLAGMPSGIGFSGAIGIMAGSIDGAGRPFPFCALLMTMRAGGAPTKPNSTVDKTLDAIEPVVLAFMESQTDRQTLISALQAAQVGLQRDPVGDKENGEPCPTGVAAMIHQGATPAWSLERAPTVYMLPGAAGGTDEECHWWHDGLGATHAGQHLVTRGLPSGPAGAPLFSTGWETAWIRREPDKETGQ